MFKFQFSVYANDNDALVPEFWAHESIAILEENMVVANLIHRDFSDMVASFGDTVNTRKPTEFEAKRKVDSDSVTVQDAVVTNVAVKLDQHIHTSFMLKDGEESKSQEDLINLYVKPAMLAQARFIDQVLLGQYWAFIANSAGRLGNLSSSTIKEYLLNLRRVQNELKVPLDGRNLILTPGTEETALNLDLFLAAEHVGDDGTALRNASLGKRLGYQMFQCQNMAHPASGNSVVTGAINNALGYAKGDVTFTVDGLSAAIPVNSWLYVAGDDTPLRVVSSVGGATPTSITVTSPGLRRAVVDNAVVTRYVPGAVNLAAGYAVGWSKEIVVDAFTVAPQVGQIVTFGTSSTSAVYTIIDVTSTTGITLDRPLEAALADNDAVNIGPRGEYNLAFTRNAMALVIRPLSLPRTGAGAAAANVSYNGLSMRAVITYDGSQQGHLVTLDMLAGVKVLDTALGAVLFG